VKGARQELLFPSSNYYLDESDPDVVILRRQDDSFVAAFSAGGATRESILEAAKEEPATLHSLPNRDGVHSFSSALPEKE
jgi:hypothetical protein